MIEPRITLLFAGLCALLQTGLTVLVIWRRVQVGVGLLDGGDQPLLWRIRAHGNFVETAPAALLLMALLECSGLPGAWLWALGTLLVAGRLLHAYGLLSGQLGQPRLIGMGLTVFVISIQGVLCLWMFVR